ncbi:hypothetical protein CDAR_468941 [Caerostris darwini]|uniref:Uncharacterized protein n=1 Tax=Caerostris darwini TaxID=1538125 RepID=A0AAV4R100_9ARAC|nr:hypothetical protein CDAR_468941 [Caerostris darwini]
MRRRINAQYENQRCPFSSKFLFLYLDPLETLCPLAAEEASNEMSSPPDKSSFPRITAEGAADLFPTLPSPAFFQLPKSGPLLPLSRPL